MTNELAILTWPSEGVAEIRLNRPSVRNALSVQMCRTVCSFLSRLRRDRSARAVILSAEGRAFCSGADRSERASQTSKEWIHAHRAFEQLARELQRVPVPLIAAVNGPAVGGGCEMVLASDLVFAAHGAWFSQPELSLGIIPGMGGSFLALERMGVLRGAEILLTGRRFTAEEGVQAGLVNAVLKEDQLMSHARAVATQVANRSPAATRAIKEILIRFRNRRSLVAEEIRAYSAIVRQLAG
ncbi:MAG: enoyl-CoA hydratase/isomerase family protein [Archangium sp.]